MGPRLTLQLDRSLRPGGLSLHPPDAQVDICISNTRRERWQTCTPHQVFIAAYTPASHILPHVLHRRSRGFIQRGKVALIERAHLVRLERTNDHVQHATTMEQDEVLFFPVVRVHQLGKARRKQDRTGMKSEKKI